MKINQPTTNVFKFVLVKHHNEMMNNGLRIKQRRKKCYHQFYLVKDEKI